MGLLEIEYLPVDILRAYEKNARRHDKASVEAIAASIREFGFDDPVGIWGDNIIVEGHGRVQAAKKLGLDKVPCIRLDHLTDEQRRAYALAHNKSAEVSDWDYDLLDMEINDLDGFTFEEFGFELVDPEIEHEKAAAKNPLVMRAKITSGKIISESQLKTMYRSALRSGDKLAHACSNAGSDSAKGLYALAKGYSGYTDNTGYYMILNRKCLTMSDTTKSTIGRSRW